MVQRLCSLSGISDSILNCGIFTGDMEEVSRVTWQDQVNSQIVMVKVKSHMSQLDSIR